MAFAKLGKVRGDEDVRDAGQHREPDRSLHLRLDALVRRGEPRRRQLHLLCVRDQLFGECCRGGPVARAVEERRADVLFEAVEATAYGGDQPYSYSFLPDVAAGLVALGSSETARGVWMLPVQPAETTRAVIARFGRAMGRDIGISVPPTWLVKPRHERRAHRASPKRGHEAGQHHRNISSAIDRLPARPVRAAQFPTHRGRRFWISLRVRTRRPQLLEGQPHRRPALRRNL